MLSERLLIIPEIGEVDTAKAEVLYALADIHGNPMGPELVRYIITTPSIERIIVFGEPGANKSTIVGQLVGELVRLTGGYLAPEVVQFDEVMSRYESVFGRSREVWDRREWNTFSDGVTQEIRTSPRQDYHSSRRGVKVIEIVGEQGLDEHGNLALRNRAASTLFDIAHDLRAEAPNTPKTLVIGLIPDPRSQERTGLIRKATASAQASEVLNIWQSQFHVAPAGLLHLPSEEVGKILKVLVERMANPVGVIRMQDEMYRLARRWYRGLERIRRIAVKQMTLPEGVLELSPEEIKTYRLKSAWMVHHLYSTLGMPPDQGFVCYSRFQQGNILWPADMFVPQVEK